MIFYISRASDSRHKPHPDAKFLDADRFNDKVYTIEFNTLEELINFTNEVGGIIIQKTFEHKFRYFKNPPETIYPNEITIYDSYVE